MIIYRELSSLEHDLNIPAKTLYAVSNRVSSHYRPVFIPKKDGTARRLFVPDAILKQIQKRILEVLLLPMEISPHATAYRDGGSPRRNALPHLMPPMLLKLDIHAFFDSIFYQQVKAAAFPPTIYAEPLRILLTLLCYHKDALPQGAPTSPAISNLVMRDFDDQLGLWCRTRGIVYTRYCDDLTFSGRFDKDEVKCPGLAPAARFLFKSQKDGVCPAAQPTVRHRDCREPKAADAARYSPRAAAGGILL